MDVMAVLMVFFLLIVYFPSKLPYYIVILACGIGECQYNQLTTSFPKNFAIIKHIPVLIFIKQIGILLYYWFEPVQN